jgi:hypothetical protein
MKIGVAYYDSRLLKHVRADLDDLVAHGCTYVVHCLSETDVIFYKESMRAVVAETKARGLEVWMDPWGIGNVFGGEPHRSAFVGLHPEAVQIRSDGVRTDWACPNQPAFHQFVREWVDHAADIGSDVVFWDEPHYFPAQHLGLPGVWTCRCDLCQDLFRRRFGYAMPTDQSEDVLTFRQDALTNLLGIGFARAKERGLNNALCPLPTDNPNRSFRDWDATADIPGLDIFGTDPYWTGKAIDTAEYVGRVTREVVALCRARGLEDHIWIQAFEIPTGGEFEVRRAIEAAAANGASNIAAWGYLGCAGMSTASCGRPELVWEMMGEAFRRLHAGEPVAGSR